MLNFTYDVSGNRLTKSKHDIGKDVYMRDASGNVMAVYGLKGEGEGGLSTQNTNVIRQNFIRQVHCLLQVRLGTQLLDGIEWKDQVFQNQLRTSMSILADPNNCVVNNNYQGLVNQLWNGTGRRNLFGNAVNEYLRSGSLNLVNRGSLVTRQRWYVYNQKEVHLYGGSRLGIDETERPLMKVKVEEVWNPFNGTWCDPVAVQDVPREVWVNGAWVAENTPFPAPTYERFTDSTGKKRYELSNHLGNVAILTKCHEW